MPKTSLSSKLEETKENKEVKEVTENKDLQAELDKRDKEIAELKAMMMSLMANQISSTSNTSGEKKEDNGYIYIKNNSVGKVNFVLDSQGNSQYYIDAGDAHRPIGKEDMNLALKVNSMRKLFEFGILEFENEQDYKIYGIVKIFDLSTESVLELLRPENIASNQKRIENLIKSYRVIEHELCYKALDLMEQGLLPREEESITYIILDRLFCAGKTVALKDLRSSLVYKRGDWKI